VERAASRVARRFRCLLGKKETENCILSSSIRSSPKRRVHTYAYAHISVTLSTTRGMLLAETILHPCRTVRNLMCLIARCAITTCPIVLCANEGFSRYTPSEWRNGTGCSVGFGMPNAGRFTWHLVGTFRRFSAMFGQRKYLIKILWTHRAYASNR